MSTTVTYSDALKDIKDFYDESVVNAYIPTLKRPLKFKPLSVNQMKKFIEIQVKAAKDEVGILSSLEMVRELNELLIENCVDKDSSTLLQKLTIIDRDSIIAQLRADNNPVIEVHTDNTNSDKTESVSIDHIPESVKSQKITDNIKNREATFKFKSGKIKLKLKLPTLYHDTHVNTYFKAQVSPYLRKGTDKVQKNIDKILSQTYFIELCKYIERLEVEKGNNTTVLTFDDTSTLTEQLEFLEELPSNLVSEINKFVRTVKDFRDSILYYVDSDGKQHPLVVDANLFTTI